jgi:Cu/Zn superoxide dismutase
MVSAQGVFAKDGDKVKFTLSLENCPTGKHNVFIHTGKACGFDAVVAGEHWDPTNAGAHGQVNKPEPHHAGDIGQVECTSDGKAMLTISTAEWALDGGNLDPIDRAVVLHGLYDTQRIACGVIRKDGEQRLVKLEATELKTNPSPNLAGTASFMSTMDGKVKLDVALTGCPEGMHGFYIHAGTECGKSGAEALAHWDPLMAGVHGQVNDGGNHHAGDAGMVMCKADLTGTFSITTDEWNLIYGDELNPVGHAVIVHGLDSATRVACGVITVP